MIIQSQRLVFIIHSDIKLTPHTDHYAEGDRPAADLAVFDVLLADFFAINENFNAFATIGAADFLLVKQW